MNFIEPPVHSSQNPVNYELLSIWSTEEQSSDWLSRGAGLLPEQRLSNRPNRRVFQGFSRNYRPEIHGGGARRNRTADLLNAIQALSQLSYGPAQNMLAIADNGRVAER